MTHPSRPAARPTAPSARRKPRGTDTAPAGHHQRAWFLAAVLLVAVVVAASAGLHRAVSHALGAVGGVIALHPVAGAFAFVGLAAMSAMLAFFSSAILVPVGVQQWGVSGTALMLLAGWLAGGLAAYAVGRFLGEPVVRRLVKAGQVRYYLDWIGHRSPFGLVLLFQAAAPSEITGYVLGIAGYPFSRYVVGRALAEAPYAAGAVFLGDQFLRGRYGLIVVLGAAAIAFLAWSLRVLHQRAGERGALAGNRLGTPPGSRVAATLGASPEGGAR